MEELEEKVKAESFKVEYDQAKCKKKKFSKEYYKCKEYEKCYTCERALTMNQEYYCPIKK